MSRKTDIRTLKNRQIDKVQSKIVSHGRMVERAKVTGTIQKTHIAQGITAMKQQIQQESISKELNAITWETLNGIYDSLAQGIYEFSNAVYENHKVVVAYNKSDDTFNRLILTAINDSKNFTERVVAIKKRHEQKSGEITDPADLDDYYAIGNDYHTLFQEFQQLSFQVTTEITTYLSGIVTASDQKQNLETLVNETLKEQIETKNTEANPEGKV